MARKISEDEIKWILSLDSTKAQKEIHKLTQNNKELEVSQKAIRSEMTKLTAEGKQNSTEYQNLNKQLKANSKEISQNKTRIQEHTKALGLDNMSLKELKKRHKELQRELDSTSKKLDPKEWNRLNQELNTTAAAMGRAGREAQKATGIFSRFGGIKGIVLGALMSIGFYLTNVFIGAFRNAYNTIKDFEAANSELAAILGKKKKDIRELTEDAMRLGKATKYTAGEVTGLQTELAKLGFNNREIIESTQHILKFAGATSAELPAAAKLAGAALRAFGMPTSETERAVSAMAIATTKSALNFEFLEIALSTVAPVARTFGFSIEETTALLGVLADSGFDASSAATATRNILLNLADDSGKLAQALGKPVRSLDEMVPALIKLRNTGIDLNTTLELTDKRSVAAFNTFLQSAEKATVLRDSITDVGEALTAMSAEKLDSVAGSTKLMESAFEGLLLKFYESRGIMKAAIDGIILLIDGVSWCVDKFTEFRVILLPLTTAIVGYVAVLKLSVLWKNKFSMTTGQLIKALKSEAFWIKADTAAMSLKNKIVGLLTGKIKLAIIAQRIWNIAMSMNPIGLVIAAVGVLITGLVMFSNKTSEAEKETKKLNKSITEFKKNIASEIAQMEYLFGVIKKHKEGSEARRGAIDLLNEKYGEYLPSLLTEKSTLQEIEIAQRHANNELARSFLLKEQRKSIEATTKTYMDKYVDMYDKFITRLAKGKSQEQKQIVETQVNDILGWLKDSKFEYNIDTNVEKSSLKTHQEFRAKMAELEKNSGKGSDETRTWLLELLGTTQKMNREMDTLKERSKGVAEAMGLNKKEPDGKEPTVVSVDDTSLLTKLEDKKAKIQKDWKEDTEANIILKNKELEIIDKEIARLKNLGKVKAENKEKDKNKKEDDKKKKANETEDKATVTVLKKTDTSRIDGVEADYTRQKIALDNSLSEQQISQEQHDMMMLSIDAVTAQKRLDVAEQYLENAQALELHSGIKKQDAIVVAGKEVLKAEADLAKARAKQSSALENMLPEFKDKFNLTNQDDELNLQLQVLEASYQARKKMAEENEKDTTALDAAYEQAKTNILQKAEDERLNAKSQYGLLTNKELFNAELEQLKSTHKKGLLSEEQYQKARGKLAAKHYLGEMQNITSMVSGAITAMQDAEMAQVDAKYDKQIEAAQGNAEEVERLENEKAQKKLDIEKKYADVQFAIKISEIIANTGLAIMTGFAQLGPIGGAIAAVMLGATGAMQIASANSERSKVKNMTIGGSGGGSERVVSGYAEGGYTGDGDRYEVAGNVHRGEYVVAMPEMRNPLVFNYVRAIEAFRRQRTTSNALPASGYADGGYVNSPGKNPTPNSDIIIMREFMLQMAAEIKAIKETPMKSYTVLSDHTAASEMMYKSQRIFTKGK